MMSLISPATKDQIADPQAFFQAALRGDLATFTGKVFTTLDPGTPFKSNWHLRAIAWRLEQVLRGDIKRLIIAMPPRSLKSISASVAYPAFIHGHDPSRQIICVSYGQDLATKLHNDYRAILDAQWYRGVFPRTRIGRWKDAENEVMLTGRGTRLATSIGGVLTGRGADIIIIDDPLKPADAHSESKRTAVNDWFSSTLLSRLNDKTSGAIIIVTQRLHADDLVGHLLERSPDDWTVLELPAIAFAESHIPIGRGKFHLRRADDVLHADREPLAALEVLRRELGVEAFSAQYLQSPVPPGGNMFKRDWVKRYDDAPICGPGDEIIQSWDTASKNGPQNDWSVCTTWLRRDGHSYLLDVSRGRHDYPTLKSQAITLARAWRANRVFIEEAGVGFGLIPDLRRENISSIGVRPEASKEARAALVTAKFESGQVFFPRQATWLAVLEAELFAFPGGRNDDQVDSIVQALSSGMRRFVILGLRD